MASKHNEYFYRLMKDETLQWLKKNDPQYSDPRPDKGLDYPYLTLKKEMKREYKETPFSNVKGYDKAGCGDYMEFDFEKK